MYAFIIPESRSNSQVFLNCAYIDQDILLYKSHFNISNTHKKKIIYLDVHWLTLKKDNFHYILFYRWKWIFHGNRVLTIQHQLRTSASSPETNLTVHLKKVTVQEDAIDMVLGHVDGLPQTLCVLKNNIQRFYERQIVQDFILYQIQWFSIHSVLTILINWRNTWIDHCLLTLFNDSVCTYLYQQTEILRNYMHYILLSHMVSKKECLIKFYGALNI